MASRRKPSPSGMRGAVVADGDGGAVVAPAQADAQARADPPDVQLVGDAAEAAKMPGQLAGRHAGGAPFPLWKVEGAAG